MAKASCGFRRIAGVVGGGALIAGCVIGSAATVFAESSPCGQAATIHCPMAESKIGLTPVEYSPKAVTTTTRVTVDKGMLPPGSGGSDLAGLS